MKVLAPFAVTDAVLQSSSVPENDHPAWNSSTAYTTGQKVMRVGVHKIFEALRGSTNKTPESSPEDWLDCGATNRWKMFDDRVGTRTTATGSIVVELKPGQITQSVALLELSARSVTVKVIDTVDGVVYNATRELQSTITSADWWHYFFEPYRRKTSVIFTGLPSYRNATLRIEITGSDTETVECGVCVFGTIHVFAEAVRYGAKIGIQDYSVKKRDDWGNTYIVERAYSRRANWNMLIKKQDVDKYQNILASLRAKPALYVGGENYDCTVIYGFYKDFDTIIEYPHYSECSIELEGLV